MQFGTQEFSKTLDQFKKGKSWLNDVTIEIEGGENEIDPLVLLRAYDAEPSVDNSLSLASLFVMNKRIVFRSKGKEVFSCVYTGGDLGEKFSKCPYYLDLLFKMSYGLMIKKLTPPSNDSENEERQSTE